MEGLLIKGVHRAWLKCTMTNLYFLLVSYSILMNMNELKENQNLDRKMIKCEIKGDNASHYE